MADQELETTGSVTVLEPAEGAEAQTADGADQGNEAEKPPKLDLTVNISDAGPCRKHIEVSVPRSDVDRFYDKEFTELLRTASVPGFRPGKTPRKLIERKFKKDVASQIKAAIILQALEQIGEDHKVEALSEPDLDYANIELPDEGDFRFEFDVEVRPEFDVPKYKGLKIKRPSRVFSDADVEAGVRSFLREQGHYETKDGPIEFGDAIDSDIRILDGYVVLKELDNVQVEIRKNLYFKDGRIDNFADAMIGLKAGDSKELTATLSTALNDANLRGREVKAVFVVKEVKHLIVPELGRELLDKFGFDDEEELQAFIRRRLEMRLAYAQRNSVREQIMKQLTESANWELPRDLLARQAKRTFDKYLVEMQDAGFGMQEIQARINSLRQDAINNTASMLREQFVLQRIAEEEKIEIEEKDLEEEIRSMAARANESFRRVRSRIEKGGLWEAVALQVIERRTLETIIAAADCEDVPYEPEELTNAGIDAAAVVDAPEAATPDAEGSKEETT